MERSAIQQRVTSVVAKVLDLDPAEVLPASNLVFDLGADSLASLALIAKVGQYPRCHLTKT